MVSAFGAAVQNQFILTSKGKGKKKQEKELVASQSIWSHSKMKQIHYGTPTHNPFPTTLPTPSQAAGTAALSV